MTALSYSGMQCWMRNHKFGILNNYVPGYEVPFIIIYFMINLILLLYDIESYYILLFKHKHHDIYIALYYSIVDMGSVCADLLGSQILT